MAKIKFYYDTESCKYIRIKTSPWDIILNTLGILLLTMAMAVGLLFLYSNYFESPKEISLKTELKHMEFYYEELKTKVSDLESILTDMTHRDDNIYRIVLGSEPLDKSIREAGAGGVERYEDIKNKEITHEEIIVNLNETLDKLRRKVVIETKSHDEVLTLAKNKRDLFSGIPSIQPVPKKEAVVLASGFGIRIHPIYKVRKMHSGIDFAAPIGTPIYAAADGIVANVEINFTGYGKKVEIDHGSGFRTRYAHMHAFLVRYGQKVKRGDVIGYVGDTGLSTAPHLHYEVFANGKHVDPIHYFFSDFTPAEYAKILELASIENQCLGL